MKSVRILCLLLIGSLAALAIADTPATDAASGAASPIVGREQVSGTLWMQRAAEYRIVTEQLYGLATTQLAKAIHSPGTAAVEQMQVNKRLIAHLPTAIIVDLDETVLDNSFYQARRALQNGEYDEASWQAWIQEASAPAIPGAVAFLKAASKAGHKIFYLTNRECQPLPDHPGDACPARTATLRNLRNLGLPNVDDPGALSLRKERPEWEGSNKTVRRAWIAKTHRIVALVGDDLRDFIDRADFEQRQSELMPLFGSRWFLLPNPMYGSWERSIVAGACEKDMSPASCAAATTAKRYAALEAAPGK